jgi:CYTH domain-containing protein
MAKETERKFLVREEILIPLLDNGGFEKKHLQQYYLVSSKDVAVRLRLQYEPRLQTILTVKAGGDGMTTNEFEFPLQNGSGLFYANREQRQGNVIEKTRHLVPHGGRVFEVDVFGGELEGLVVAELEADDAALVTDLPDWIDEEVTFDPSYKNAVLALQGAPAAFATRLSTTPDTLEAIRCLNNPARTVISRRAADRIPTSNSVMATLAALDFEPREFALARDERSKALDGPGALDGELLDIEEAYYRSTEGRATSTNDQSDDEGDAVAADLLLRLLAEDDAPDASDGRPAGWDDLADLTGSLPDTLSRRRAMNARLQQNLDAIVVGEIADEPSRELAKLAAAIGRQPWPDPDPLQEERSRRVQEALAELDPPFDFETHTIDTDSQKGN